MRLAFVDLETTGAMAAADRVTEVGIVLVDETGVREWSSLVNPEAPIPPFIEQLTGISDEMVAGAPLFGQVAGEVLALLEGRLFIAHNARFDYGFLRNEFGRLGVDFRATVLCTVKLSRRLYPQHHKHSLDSLIQRHGLCVDGRHRALGDARLIHQFWELARAEVGEEAVAAAVSALTARPSLPPQLDARIVNDLPAGSGVYLFYGENDQPLYVGRGKDLRKRVLAHFAAQHPSARAMDLSRQVRRIDWIETVGEIGAQLREAVLVRRLQPLHNRASRGGEALCAWRLSDAGGGAWVPRLVLAGEADFAAGENLFGPFRSPREARKFLRDLADRQGLCHGLLGLDRREPGRPCGGRQAGRCRGACVGRESPSQHSGRLMAALGKLKIAPWPFPGPAYLREGDEIHLADRWRYLGTARTEAEVADMLAAAPPPFDADIYTILVKAARQLQPVALHHH